MQHWSDRPREKGHQPPGTSALRQGVLTAHTALCLDCRQRVNVNACEFSRQYHDNLRNTFATVRWNIRACVPTYGRSTKTFTCRAAACRFSCLQCVLLGNRSHVTCYTPKRVQLLSRELQAYSTMIGMSDSSVRYSELIHICVSICCTS